MDAHFLWASPCQMTCWCCVENKQLPNIGPSSFRERLGSWKWPLSPWFGDLTVNSARPATPQTASPPASSLHYPAIAWGPITPAALSVSLFPLSPSLSLSVSLTLFLPSSSSRLLSLQALFTLGFQELPVSPDWLKQTLTLFWYLIQLCSFSSHWPWSTQRIRYPGSHRAPPLWLILDFKHSGTSHMVGKE